MLQIWALDGIREITPGDDLVGVILDAMRGPLRDGADQSLRDGADRSLRDGADRSLRDGADRSLRDGDIVVVTSKIVSKAEGRIIEAADREDAITRETVRLVASRTSPTGHVTRIVENPLGIVSAAAGVDASNTPEGTVLLLPVDPDASARALATGLRTATGAHVGVIITDTLGRAWREGQTDHAIGAGGIHVFEDLRGTVDAEGRPLVVTLPCVADEIAAATDLVKGKASRRPVAIVRGRADLVGDLDLPGARSIVRDPVRDMFRQGADEAYAEGFAAGRAAGA